MICQAPPEVQHRQIPIPVPELVASYFGPGWGWLAGGQLCSQGPWEVLVGNSLDRSEQCSLAAENELYVGLYKQRWVSPGSERWWRLLGSVQNSAG